MMYTCAACKKRVPARVVLKVGEDWICEDCLYDGRAPRSPHTVGHIVDGELMKGFVEGEQEEVV